MNLLTGIMGMADFICISLVMYAYGSNTFTVILFIIMIGKGLMSFS